MAFLTLLTTAALALASTITSAVQLLLVVRANVEIDDKPRPATRAIFTGTLEQIGEDLEICERIGAHEVHFDPLLQPGAHSLNRRLELMEQLRELR
jgi:hypothetical protein